MKSLEEKIEKAKIVMKQIDEEWKIGIKNIPHSFCTFMLRIILEQQKLLEKNDK